MPEYTLATLISMLVVIAIELFWLRTGVFRSLQYWLSMLIMFSFQILVDGWLTKLSNPIVIYNPDNMLGVRFPWDIPIEDFGFAFAMLTLTLVVWKHLTREKPEAEARVTSGSTRHEETEA